MKIVKPSNMEIKVTSCADCPFRDASNYCERVKTYVFNHVTSVHPSCPLKQQSITVKLDQEYQKQKQ